MCNLINSSSIINALFFFDDFVDPPVAPEVSRNARPIESNRKFVHTARRPWETVSTVLSQCLDGFLRGCWIYGEVRREGTGIVRRRWRVGTLGSPRETRPGVVVVGGGRRTRAPGFDDLRRSTTEEKTRVRNLAAPNVCALLPRNNAKQSVAWRQCCRSRAFMVEAP